MAIVQNDYQTHFKKNEILKVRKLAYTTPGNRKFSISVPGMSIKSGDFVLIQGENGAGKTTLVQLLSGQLPSPNTQIWINNKLQPKVEDLLIPGYVDVACVQQQPDLNPFLTVEDQLKKGSRGQVPGAWLRFHKQLIKWCRLGNLMKEKTGNLSGGERKRLALALSLAHPVSVLFLDEPFADLDLANQALFRSVLFQLSQNKNLAIVVVSHEPWSFLYLATVVYTLSKGKIIEKTLRTSAGFLPKKELSARLMGFENVLPDGLGGWQSIACAAVSLHAAPNARPLGSWQYCGINYPSGRGLWFLADRFLESNLSPNEKKDLVIGNFYNLFALNQESKS